MDNVRKWTLEEVDFLKTSYQARKPIKEIALQLQRTEASVKTKVTYLGIATDLRAI